MRPLLVLFVCLGLAMASALQSPLPVPAAIVDEVPAASSCAFYAWVQYNNSLWCLNAQGNGSKLYEFNRTSAGYIWSLITSTDRLTIINGSLYFAAEIFKHYRDDGNSTVNFVQFNLATKQLQVSPPLSSVPGHYIYALSPYDSWVDPQGAMYVSVDTTTYSVMIMKWSAMNSPPKVWTDAAAKKTNPCYPLAQALDFVNSIAYSLLQCSGRNEYTLTISGPSRAPTSIAVGQGSDPFQRNCVVVNGSDPTQPLLVLQEDSFGSLHSYMISYLDTSNGNYTLLTLLHVPSSHTFYELTNAFWECGPNHIVTSVWLLFNADNSAQSLLQMSITNGKVLQHVPLLSSEPGIEWILSVTSANTCI